MNVRTTSFLIALGLAAGCGGGALAPGDMNARFDMEDSVAAGDLFPVYIELENTTDDPLRLSNVTSRLRIERDGRIVCQSEDFAAVSPEGEDLIIAPRSSRRIAMRSPCGVEERDDDFDIVAELRFDGGR